MDMHNQNSEELHDNKIIRKRYDIGPCTISGQELKGTIQLPKDVQEITGIYITADLEEKIYHRGQMKVSLGGEEIFPEDYHCRLYMAGLGVAPDDRYFTVSREPGNHEMKVHFTDYAHPSIPHSTYLISLYLRMRII